MNPRLGHVDLLRIFSALSVRFGRLCDGPEVDHEAEDVKGEDQADDPFEDGALVLVVFEEKRAEDSGKYSLDDDEDELDPEAETKFAMLAVLDPEPLVFPACEDGAEHVAEHEEEEEESVQFRVPKSVEEGKEDETGGAEKREEDREYR